MSASRTVTQLPSAIDRGGESTDTLDDQIRGYRRTQRARFLAQRRLRRTFSRNYRQSLEQQLDPNEELSLSRRRRANLVPAEVLYSYNNDEPRNRVYQHYEEIRSHVVDRQLDLRFIEEGSYQTLVRAGMQHIHVGMMMLRLQTLHRVDAGISAMVVFRDTRWSDDRQIISAMTMDLTRGTQMVYAIPNIMLSIHDFFHHVQVSIRTRGYGTGWTGGDSNLIVTRSMIGRITNTSQANFNYQIDGVSDYLASQGVQAVPGEPWNVVNRETSWELTPSSLPPPAQTPTSLITRQRVTGNISIRFTGYQDAPSLPYQTEEETEEEQGRAENSDQTHYALVLQFNPEENWGTLGEPSGKFDYMVKYTAKPTEWPTEPSGWGNEFDDCRGNQWKWDDETPQTAAVTTQEETYSSDEILDLYPRRKPKQEQQWVPKLKTPVPQIIGTSSSSDPFADLNIRSGKSTLVQDWLAQLGSGSELSDSEEPKYDTSDSDSEYSYKTHQSVRAFAGKVQLEYPTKVEKAKEKLETLEKAYAIGDISMKEETSFIPPNPSTGNIRYPPADRPAGPSTAPNDGVMFGLTPPNTLQRPGKFGRPLASWQLPSAQQTQGAILVLPAEVASHADAITTWEAITLNLIRGMVFESLQTKVEFIEELLGPREKEAWISWRMQYEAEYSTLVQTADEPRNVTSTIKRVLGVQDPFTGNLHIQNRAYADLERLQCPNMESIMPFLFRYYQLAAQSGKMWAGTELSDKLFRKLPPEIGPMIQKEYQDKYPGLTVGVNARIQFITEYLQNLCKQADLQRKLKNLNFCRAIPIPGYYETGSGKKKYGIRKAKNYRGKPHDTHVKVIKNKHKEAVKREGKKCRCYLCGIEGHFARECPKQRVKPERAAFYDGLGLDVNWDILSVEPGEQMDDDICSISEGEAQCMEDLPAFQSQLPYPVEAQYDTWKAYVVITTGSIPEKKEGMSWRVSIPLDQVRSHCQHDWDDTVVLLQGECHTCKEATQIGRRATCKICFLNLCALCASLDFGLKIIPKSESTSTWYYNNKDELIQKLYEHNVFLMQQIQGLQTELAQYKKSASAQPNLMELDDTEPFSAEKAFFKGGGGLSFTSASAEPSPATGANTVPLGPRLKGIAEELTLISSTEEDGEDMEWAFSEMPKGGNNKLYHVIVVFKISPTPGAAPLEFEVNAIIDTGCTCCCINSTKVPEDAVEEAKMIQNVSGINSTTRVTKKLKAGKMILAGTEFYTPYISVFPMNMPKIDMLIGCNFIRAMKGGLRFEGTEVTFYKTVTKIQTTLEPQRIAYLEELIEEEDLKLEIAANTQDFESLASKIKNSQLLKDLKDQGYIGEDPVRHWAKNGVKCKLEIINPDITIEDKPPGDLSVEEKARYQRHIQVLLDLGVIRPSKSKHRTAAFIVKSGTTVDPITGKETKGKERMVYNYKMLNDNTHKDQYTLPGINSIIKSLGGAKIFSKFDLKSGFHQVAMDEESIPWTAFISPAGLYEWLVMPFGLKNAPAVFQRKMDECFKGTEEFIAVYIDDILVFSSTIKEHEKHLQVMLEICQKHGLVLSPTKMKIACREVEFLGAIIREGKIKLQPHIIKKIADVEEKSLLTLKGLRSWLGVLNYARAYIPKCGTLLGPLYSKTSEHGDRRWRPADWKIVRQIKQLVQELPDLEIPPPRAYIVIETDGCMEGWGGVCKWKEAKAASIGSEKVCAYASGKFPVVKSTIDAEIFAVMESLEKFKLFYMDKGELTLRTDCQAIIAFYEKMAVKKPSRVRWIGFCDYITNTGITVHFEHIKGDNNQLADQLSRLAQQVLTAQAIPEEAHEALLTVLECPDIGLLSSFNSLMGKVIKAKSSNHSAYVLEFSETPYKNPAQGRSSSQKMSSVEGVLHRIKRKIKKLAKANKVLLLQNQSFRQQAQRRLQQELTAQITSHNTVGPHREEEVSCGSAPTMASASNLQDPVQEYTRIVEELYTGEPMEFNRMMDNSWRLAKIEEEAAEKLKAAMADFVEIQNKKHALCQRQATQSNYWGEWLPHSTVNQQHVTETANQVEALIHNSAHFKI
uniref:RNA-directed DNA polymerase n=1 Tax=Green Sichuan pepper vein clearing-associated virus TaxID=2802539 RepID=A0A513Q1D8_9VIRU|nr:polyprotein [Green Sichuan pepper vein clearing-associated virus]